MDNLYRFVQKDAQDKMFEIIGVRFRGVNEQANTVTISDVGYLANG